MKLIKSLLFNFFNINSIKNIKNINNLHYHNNNLHNNNLHNNKNYIHNYNKQDTLTLFKNENPIKYSSFKKSKKYYFENNIYFDIYRETPNLHNSILIDDNYKHIYYKKYTDLTAEHIFPQSYLKKYPKAKFDMHNIFLTIKQINCNRSNYKYTDENKYFENINNKLYYREHNDNINDNCILYDKNINYKINKLKLFIPYANSRGIIARSIAYMKFKYDNIILDNVIDLEILLYWNYLYPPTTVEKLQNEKIKQLQGNYNYFIQNPELIEKYFI